MAATRSSRALFTLDWYRALSAEGRLAFLAARSWRVLFWVGVLPALLVLWARARVVDPPAYRTALYPSAHRGAGQGFTYNLGRGASGLVTGGIGLLATTMDLSGAIAVGAAVYLVALAGLLFLPETRGRDLTARSSVAPAVPASGSAQAAGAEPG